MLDRYAKEKYQQASSLLDEINGEEIRELLLKITIENARVNIFKAVDSRSVTDVEDISLLEKLAKSLLFRLVYDNNLNNDIIEGAALVCAQAYEKLSPDITENVQFSMNDIQYLNRIIAALLYFVSGYDPNAAYIAKSVSELSYIQNDLSVEYIVMRNISAFVSFKFPDVITIAQLSITLKPATFNELNFVTKEALLWELNQCIFILSQELLHYHGIWNPIIKVKLLRLYELSIECKENSIALLSLVILLVNNSFSTRSLSTLQAPEDCKMEVWHAHMERYIDERKYLIWIPHREAIQKGLMSQQNDIIAIPTGTGKSLIAEHKIIASLQRDSIVIYLAPTNALCRQISTDVKKILNVQNKFDGQAIIIDDLDNFEFKLEENTKLILVLTPEKCTVLLSNRPEIFLNISLCVVDEFHNINNGERGALLDTLLARLSEKAPNLVYLLLSALMDNAEILPIWLKKLNGRHVESTFTRWRPSRTLRGFISHPLNEYNQALLEANASRKKKFQAEISTDLFFCIQDVWNKSESRTAYPIRIPKKFKIRFILKENWKKEKYWTTEGYGNDISRELGNWLSSCRIPVLIFSQTTRHLMTEISNHSKIKVFDQNINAKVRAHLIFAKEELGFTSELLLGISSGIGIHTQAVIEDEQLAVEEFFRSCTHGIVCATGTLAQGLNLPASAVVVNTTKQHVSDEEAPKPMSKSEVINMLGRAGRPGLGFQSIGIIVPQYPSTHNKNGYKLEEEYSDYLERIDAIVPVGSGLKNIIESLSISQADSANDNFLFMLNSIGFEHKINKKIILKTLASNFVSEMVVDQAIANCDRWLKSISEDSKLQNSLEIANKSNTSIEIVNNLLESIDEQVTLNLLNNFGVNVTDWIDWFIVNLNKLSGKFLETNIHKLFNSPKIISKFTSDWVSGRNILEISQSLFEYGIGKPPVAQKRDSQSSVAKTIHIIQDGKRNIVHLANCYVVIVEKLIETSGSPLSVPKELKNLSQCLNAGVNNLSSLRFRKIGLPRNVALQLGYLFQNDSLSELIEEWKSTNEINGTSMSNDLKNAIITLL